MNQEDVLSLLAQLTTQKPAPDRDQEGDRPKQKAPGRPRGVGSHGRTTLPERNRLKAQQPGARSGRWTEEEHSEFLRLHAIHGRKWTLIAEDMPFRTEP